MKNSFKKVADCVDELDQHIIRLSLDRIITSIVDDDYNPHRPRAAADVIYDELCSLYSKNQELVCLFEYLQEQMNLEGEKQIYINNYAKELRKLVKKISPSIKVTANCDTIKVEFSKKPLCSWDIYNLINYADWLCNLILKGQDEPNN